MGFEISRVLSEQRHHGNFVCAICQNLVDLDCLVTTKCSHCFCRPCLQEWLDKSPNCPTCNQNLSYSDNQYSRSFPSMMMEQRTVLVQPLSRAQPLAHRLLQTVLVECPLRSGVNCQWKGDYGDLQSHLLSSTAHSTEECMQAVSQQVSTSSSNLSPMEVDATQESEKKSGREKKRHYSLALSLKEEANDQFQSRHYEDALSLYRKAIDVLEGSSPRMDSETDANDFMANYRHLLSTLYSNRAAAHLTLQQYRECLDDCRHVVDKRLDPSNYKVFLRAARAETQLANLTGASRWLENGLRQHPGSAILAEEAQKVQQMVFVHEQGEAELADEQYAAAKGSFDKLLRESPSGVNFLLGAAQADLGLGLTDSALRLTKKVLLKHAQNPRGCWIRGQVAFLMGDADVGLSLLQEALRLDPDSSVCLQSYKQAKQVKECMARARSCMFSRKFEEAIDLLSLCTALCKPLPPKTALYATIYTERAEAHLRHKQFNQALKDCSMVLYAQEYHIPAWLIRFKAHHGLGDNETVLDLVSDLLEKFPESYQLKQAWEQADFLVRKERRVDFYALLGVSRIASEMEIKKAYKKKALELHPDKLPTDTPDEGRRKARESFQLLGEVLEILTDDFKRKLYDQGYDPEAILERVEAAKHAAQNYHQYGH